MRSLTQLARQTGRLLSARARRLHANLERLAIQVREAVARTVSQTVAEATHEALQLVLEGPPTMSGAWQPSPEGFRRSWDTDDTNDPRGWSTYPPRTRYGSPGQEYDWEDEDDAEESPGRDATPESARPRRWSRALSVGCQAAAWWLRRHPGRLSGVAAAGIGVAAGLVAFLASPLLASAGTVAATALGVLALADAARSAAGVAATWK